MYQSQEKTHVKVWKFQNAVTYFLMIVFPAASKVLRLQKIVLL